MPVLRREVLPRLKREVVAVHEGARLVVILLAVPEEAHIGVAAFENAPRTAQHIGLIGVVRVADPHILAPSLGDSRVARARETEVALMVHDTNARIACSCTLGNDGGGIGRGVVDHDKLPRALGLLQDALKGLADVGLHAVAGHHDGEERGVLPHWRASTGNALVHRRDARGAHGIGMRGEGCNVASHRATAPRSGTPGRPPGRDPPCAAGPSRSRRNGCTGARSARWSGTR